MSPLIVFELFNHEIRKLDYINSIDIRLGGSSLTFTIVELGHGVTSDVAGVFDTVTSAVAGEFSTVTSAVQLFL
jgi:hypothetical protein